MSESRPTRPTRRELLRPVQLLGLAAVAALFAGVVTLVSTGFFQGGLDGSERSRSLVLALIVAGIAFIVTLVSIALLVLAVDPAEITRPVDRAVLLPPEESDAADERPEGRSRRDD